MPRNKAYMKHYISVVFEMDINDARKLKELFQNPLYADETAEESAFREKMWKLLDEAENCDIPF